MFKEYFYLKKKVKLHLRNDLPKKSLIYESKSGDKNDLTTPQPCEIPGHMVLLLAFLSGTCKTPFFLSFLLFFLPRHLIIGFPSQSPITCTIAPISHSF